MYKFEKQQKWNHRYFKVHNVMKYTLIGSCNTIIISHVYPVFCVMQYSGSRRNFDTSWRTRKDNKRYRMWENFGGGKFLLMKQLVRKNLANLLAVFKKTSKHVIILRSFLITTKLRKKLQVNIVFFTATV